jgi:hypothetical protein
MTTEYNLGFRRFINESGLPFWMYAEFRKGDLDAWKNLYRGRAKQIRSPNRLAQEETS